MSPKTALYKGDMLIIALVLLAAIAGFFMIYGRQNPPEGALRAELYLDGQLTEIIPLTGAEREIRVENNGGYNVLHISSGGICVLEADCHNQDCVLSGRENQPGAIIACLPHRLLLRLVGGEDTGVDAIAY